jgi:hypothetical protein
MNQNERRARGNAMHELAVYTIQIAEKRFEQARTAREVMYVQSGVDDAYFHARKLAGGQEDLDYCEALHDAYDESARRYRDAMRRTRTPRTINSTTTQGATR